MLQSFSSLYSQAGVKDQQTVLLVHKWKFKKQPTKKGRVGNGTFTVLAFVNSISIVSTEVIRGW